MKKSIYFFIFLSFISLVEAASIDFQISSSEVKQGDLTEAKIILDPVSAQMIPLQKFKGQTLGEAIYLYDVSPLVRREGAANFEADAKIIFVKVPETKSVTHKYEAQELLVTWSPVTVIQTKAIPNFVFGEFEIPFRKQWFIGLIASILFIALIISGYVLRKKFINKKNKKLKKKELKSELLKCQHYNEVVELWRRKPVFLKEFPEIEDPLKNLEVTLFKYQFKPVQSQLEQQEVVKAYEVFKEQVGARLNGV